MEAGVHTPATVRTYDPRQQMFLNLYCDPDSKNFGNCYQSAIKAGYSSQTARNLTHNRPAWFSEKLGQMKVIEPELLLIKLTTIINGHNEATQNKLRAIDMMMKHYRMFGGDPQTSVQINIQDILI